MAADIPYLACWEAYSHGEDPKKTCYFHVPICSHVVGCVFHHFQRHFLEYIFAPHLPLEAPAPSYLQGPPPPASWPIPWTPAPGMAPSKRKKKLCLESYEYELPWFFSGSNGIYSWEKQNHERKQKGLSFRVWVKHGNYLSGWMLIHLLKNRWPQFNSWSWTWKNETTNELYFKQWTYLYSMKLCGWTWLWNFEVETLKYEPAFTEHCF